MTRRGLLLLGALVSGALTGCAGEPPAEPSERVFLIGLDGATWGRIDPLLAQERLPNLAALIAEGARAEIGSMLPTKSPALWTTVVTGKEFDKHGINDFTKIVHEDGWENVRVMHMTSNLRKTKALWNIMGDVRQRSAFVGWWVSWPAEQVAGYMVSSHMPLELTGARATPTKGTLFEGVQAQTWPRELFEELRPLIRPADGVTFEEAREFMDISEDEMGRDRVEGFRWAYAADETYRSVVQHLLEKDPDVALWGIYFNGIDVVEHRYWRYNEPLGYRPFPREDIPRFEHVIDRYYEYTDELLGEILAHRRPGDTFVIVSDHGFHARGHKDAPAGVLVAAGNHIDPGAAAEGARLVDITPTVLALLGLPLAGDMDGRALDELFTAAWRQSYSQETLATYDTKGWQDQNPIPSELDDALMERLRGLGYVE